MALSVSVVQTLESLINPPLGVNGAILYFPYHVIPPDTNRIAPSGPVGNFVFINARHN